MKLPKPVSYPTVKWNEGYLAVDNDPGFPDDLNLSENLDVIIAYHPHFNSLNKRLLKDAEEADYCESYKTNVRAEMSDWKTVTPTIHLVLEWINTLIRERYNSYLSVEDAEYALAFLDAWFARYGIDDYTKVHNHYIHAQFGFVYFVNAPKGSSPLVFTTSNTKIKAEEGKMVIFTGCMYHHVPKNKCKDRIVLSGNLGLIKRNNKILKDPASY